MDINTNINKMIDNIVNELVMMMDTYPSHDIDERFVFIDENGIPNVYARKLGQDLHTMGGSSLLHEVMNKLMSIVDVKVKNGEDWLVFDLRQLEFCWDNIGDWMA